jgi:4-hydroxybenzoate polyprenyltransferase
MGVPTHALVALSRPFTLLAPAVGVTCGALAASGATGLDLPVDRVTLGVLAALVATAASNAWNQVFDLELDRINKPERPLVRGSLTSGTALRCGHLLAVFAVALAAFSGVAYLACLLIGLSATWIYSAPPLRLRRFMLPALFTIAIPRGLLVPVAGWSLVAPVLQPEPWALGLVTGLFVLGAAATKDFADMEGDKQGGCVSLPIRLGPKGAAWAVAPFLLLPFLLFPVLARLGLLTPPTRALDTLGYSLAAAGLVVAFLLVRDPQRLARRGENHPAWAGMYLLLLGTFVGIAITYGAS